MSIPAPLATQTDDHDLFAGATILAYTTPNDGLYRRYEFDVAIGAGLKPVDGTGGDFELTLIIGSKAKQPSPQIIKDGGSNTSLGYTSAGHVIPPNTPVVMLFKSPNAADTDVTCSVTVYDISPPAVELAALAEVVDDIAVSVQTLGITGAAIAAPVTAVVLTTYGSQVNSYTDTETANDIRHTLTDSGGTLTFEYHFELGDDGVPISLTVLGALTSSDDDLSVQAWDFADAIPAWQTIGKREGVNQTPNFAQTHMLNTHHVSPTGEVRIRFTGTGLTSATFYIDQCYVSYAVVVTPAANADAVWDEMLAAHLNLGSTGEALGDVSTGGDATLANQTAILVAIGNIVWPTLVTVPGSAGGLYGYCDGEDIVQMYGESNVIKWADLDGDADPVKIASRTAAAIVRATTYIDDTMRDSIYSIPFTHVDGSDETVPQLIVELTAMLSGVWLYESRGVVDFDPNTGQAYHRLSYQKRHAQDILEGLHKGRFLLDATLTPEAIAEAAEDLEA